MKLIIHLRTSSAYLLLIMFSLAGVSRELWHYDEHYSINFIGTNSEKAQYTTKEACPICSLHIIPIITPVCCYKLTSIEEKSEYYPCNNCGQEFSLSTTLRLRGPPTPSHLFKALIQYLV